jgi:hypothetical protein
LRKRRHAAALTRCAVQEPDVFRRQSGVVTTQSVYPRVMKYRLWQKRD